VIRPTRSRGAGSRSAFRIGLAKSEICVTNILVDPRAVDAWVKGRECVSPRGFRAQPVTRVEAGEDFFIWIRCNPLKSPDSAKGIQGNPSIFPLVLLGFPWIYLLVTRPEVVSIRRRPKLVLANLPTPPARSTAPSRRPGASPSRSARRRSAESAPAPRRRGNRQCKLAAKSCAKQVLGP